MYYLSDYQAEFMFRRKPRSDKGKKRKPLKDREIKNNKLEKATNIKKGLDKSMATVNRTSEELRGWTNTLMRLKRMADGNF